MNRRPSLGALGAALVILAGGCGGGGSGARGAPGGPGAGSSAPSSSGSPSSTQTPAPAPQRGPTLEAATLVNTGGGPPGAASAGDAVILRFDSDADLSQLSLAGVRLLAAADTLGSGAAIAVTSPREATITLGQGAALSLYKTFMPGGGANASPAAVSVDPTMVRGPSGLPARAGRPMPILLDRPSRLMFQGDQSRGTFSPYLGQMHCHTIFSDGIGGDPGTAYDMARFQGGLDWFMVSDHYELMSTVAGRWDETKRQADARNVDGTFTALTGYEWSYGFYSIVQGVMVQHCNVVSSELLDLAQSAGLLGFYQNVTQLPDDAIGKFNHPGLKAKKFMNLSVTFNNWDDYRHDAAADKNFALCRVMVGTHDDLSGFIPLLDHGWHVAPAYGEDNHQGQWGKGPGRMGVFASFLTRDGLKEAMRARRTFTSSTPHGWIRMMATDEAGELWMGSTVAGPGPVELKIDGGDPDHDIEHVEIVSTTGAVVATYPVTGARAFDFGHVVDPTGDAYFYARAIEASGDVLYSAPIYVDR